MYAQCDADRNEYLLLDALVDYGKDNNVISLTEQQTRIHGRPIAWKTTAGQPICCQWKDSSTSWDELLNLKESHLVQTAKFAVVQLIDHKPSFNWWVKHVLQKRDTITASIRKQQTRYLKKCHKCGIEISKTVEQILALDAKNGNTIWANV